jgi:8-oxo-dGTP pyrophosphatase MutT (NUDIX family)
MYRNPWLVVTEYRTIRPDGNPGIYGVVDPGDNVTIVAVNEARQVLLVRDFVYPVQTWARSLPSGAVEPTEEPLAAARRELAEEGGVSASEWVELGAYWLTCGISPQTSYLYLARSLQVFAAHPEPTEVITREWVDFAEALALARSGEIRDAPSALGLMLAAAHAA